MQTFVSKVMSLFFKMLSRHFKWFLTLGYSGVFELQLPETPASTAGGEGF